MTIKELKNIVDQLVTSVDENTPVMGLARAGTLEEDIEVEVKDIALVSHRFYGGDKYTNTNINHILIRVI